MTKPVLQVVIASTRPGRVGDKIGEWFVEEARKHDLFDVQVADLAELNLPMMDEPNHPSMHQYTHEHTKRWSEIVECSDAFVFVMPEYNFSFNAALKNAIDYLFVEWAYKPASFVSYGGISGGIRAVQMLKQVLTTLRMIPLTQQVAIPYANTMIDEGVFTPSESVARSVEPMLTELHRMTLATTELRN